MIQNINEKIVNIKFYISSEFVRKPRSLKEFGLWKATEFRLFLLYTGVVLLSSINKDQYEHFLQLNCAIYILSNQFLISKYLNIAEKCLEKFVVDAKTVYGEDFVVYNVHNLLHLPYDVNVGTSSNHFCNTPSVEGVGTSTLDDRSTHRQDQLNTRDKTRLNANTFLLLVLYYSINC
jgi:hypothetical protein